MSNQKSDVGPSLIVLHVDLRYSTSLMSAALAARASWLEQGDRSLAVAAFLATKAEAQAQSGSNFMAALDRVIVPAATISLLLNRTDKVCVSFSEMFDGQADGVKYADAEITAACKALPVLLVHELSRIVSLNGSIPARQLSALFEVAKEL